MNDLTKIKYPPLQDKFTKWGDTFEIVSKNKRNRMYCYRRITKEGVIYFEVFRSRIVTNDDGTTYERYPKTSEFGRNAWCIRNDSNTQKKIEGYMSTPIDE